MFGRETILKASLLFLHSTGRNKPEVDDMEEERLTEAKNKGLVWLLPAWKKKSGGDREKRGRKK